MRKYVDDLARWSVLIPSFFLIIGLVRGSLYFLTFGIPINNYIEVNDLFTMWFPETVYALGTLVLFAIILLSTRIIPTSGLFKKPVPTKSYNVDQKSLVYIIHVLLIAFFIFDLKFNLFNRHTLTALRYVSITPYFIIMKLLIIVGIIASAAGILTNIVYFNGYRFLNAVKILSLINWLLIFSYALVYSVYEPQIIELSATKAYHKLTLISDHRVIESNDQLLYVGKTRNYFFLWNKKTHETRIYPASEFKEIRINPNW